MSDTKLTKAQKQMDKNNNGKIDAEDLKMLRKMNSDRTSGADPEFSRDVEAANRNRQREQAARIKREMKEDDAKGFMHGGMVKKYRYGGEVKGYSAGGMAEKGKKCPHRGTVRGTGAAIGGGKFRGVR